jgi:hypothetical protein
MELEEPPSGGFFFGGRTLHRRCACFETPLRGSSARGMLRIAELGFPHPEELRSSVSKDA